MLARVLETILQHRLIEAGQRILVGLSGGPDSCALLLALQKLSPRLGFEVRALCVDHGLRAESAAEAARVAAMSASWGVPCAVVRVDVAALRTAHVSWQDAARRARLAALEAAAEQGCDVVALGHSADDQAETVLFRIVRGTGLQGLAGIPYRRGVFIRPLLDIRRSEIEAFVGQQGVTPVRDPSNENVRYTRSRVRHEWMPLLARENPRLVEALLGLAADAQALPGRPAPAGVIPHVSRRAARQIQRASARGGTSAFDVTGGILEVTYGRRSFRPRLAPPAAPPEPLVVAAVKTDLHFVWGAGAVKFKVGDAPAGSGVAFDHEKIVWPLTVRPWRAGDRMHPRKGRGSRKLQDLLVDAKVPRGMRGLLPVLVDADDNILFVPHLRAAQAASPTTQTKTFLVVEAENFVISPK
ncbi:MAG: tRNA lysidine(34) synthetase TilS [Deltaproteobacteria bacterium]|nr:tRNA lysidine(34) synthetase TilS [Deltaproteobacteria bacterium]